MASRKTTQQRFHSFIRDLQCLHRDINFTRKWTMSDIIILTTEESRVALHANKTVLAMHSSYFQKLFFSEKPVEEKITVAVDYLVMLEILKIIHHSDRKFGMTGHSLYPPQTLAGLYKASITLEMPIISQLCQQQLLEVMSKDAFEVCIKLGLQKEKREALKKMSFADVETYLKKNDSGLVLSPSDVLLMVEKCKEFEMTRCPQCRDTNIVKDSSYDQNYYRCRNQHRFRRIAPPTVIDSDRLPMHPFDVFDLRNLR